MSVNSYEKKATIKNRGANPHIYTILNIKEVLQEFFAFFGQN